MPEITPNDLRSQKSERDIHLEILKSLPWTISPSGDSIIVKEADIPITHHPLLIAIAESRTAECPIFASYHGRGRGKSIPTPTLTLREPEYIDDPHMPVWRALASLAEQRFRSEMAELTKLPWLPRPNGMTGIGYDGPFFILATSLNPEQRDQLERHRGVRVDYYEGDGVMWPEMYTFHAGGRSIGDEINCTIGADQIAAAITARREALGNLMTRFPWRLSSGGELTLRASEAKKSIKRLSAGKPKQDSETESLIPVASALISAQEKKAPDGAIVLTVRERGADYWDTGDVLGQDDLYARISRVVVNQEMSFLARFVKPENHQESESRDKLFAEGAILGFCKRVKQRYILTEKLLGGFMPPDAPREIARDRELAYENARQAICKQPNLFGLVAIKVQKIEAASWKIGYRECRKEDGTEYYSLSHDWESAAKYYQVKEAISILEESRKNAAYADRARYAQLPWRLVYPTERHSSDKAQILIYNNAEKSDTFSALRDSLHHSSWLGGWVIPDPWTELSEYITRPLEARVSEILSELPFLPFEPGEKYGVWVLSRSELAPEHLALIQELERLTNLVNSSSKPGYFIVFSHRRENEKTFAELPYITCDRLCKEFVARTPAAPLIVPPEVIALNWAYDESSDLVIEKKRVPSHYRNLFREPLFTTTGFPTEAWNLKIPDEYSVSGQSRVEDNVRLTAERKAWVAAIHPAVNAKVLTTLRQVAELPWKQFEARPGYWMIDSREIRRSDAKLLGALPRFLVHGDRIPRTNGWRYFINSEYYKLMRGDSDLDF